MQVAKRAEKSVPHCLPNLVLINVDTNDATQNGSEESVVGTGARMKSMINGIFSTVPNAVVVITTLLTNTAHGDDRVSTMMPTISTGSTAPFTGKLLPQQERERG